jgi:ABC-type polysaccharide/polyol phosphate export permease
MIGRITRIWAKPLSSWTLVDLVRAILVLSLVSIACGFVLSIVAVIPAVVAKGHLRKPLDTDAVFENG